MRSYSRYVIHSGITLKWPANMAFLLCGLVCTLILIQVPMATAGDVCNDSAIIVTVNTGTDARLFYNRSNLENGKYFLGYRAYALSSLFAFINKTESVGTCTEPVMEICSNGKAKFMGWNQTLLMIKIVNVAVNDSGKYKVVALFSDKHYNPKTEKCLQVHHLNVSEIETTTSPTSQWTQVHSPSSSSANSISARALRAFDNLAWIITTVTIAVVMSVNPSTG